MMENKKYDKDLFTLVQNEEVLYDDKMQNEPIGYFKDAWIRFKRNRISLVAFIIVVTLILLAIIGPYFNKWGIDDREIRLKEIPPRVELLSGIGIFDGTKVLDGRQFADFTNPNLLGMMTKDEDFWILRSWESEKCTGNIVVNDDGIEECYASGGQIPFESVTFVDVRVDYYLYIDYLNTYGDNAALTLTEEAYLELDPDIIVGTPNKFTGDVCYGIEDTVDDVLICTDTITGEDIGFTEVDQYRVRVKYWQYLGYDEGTHPNFWFGTDSQGRDLFTIVWLGARMSFIVAFLVAAINITVGVIMGAISGYYGALTDLILQRVFEIISGIPFLALLTLLALRFGATFWVVVVAFTLTGWIGISRTVRAQFFRYKNREYVLAARTLGAKDLRLMARHIFPNAIGTIVTSVVLIIPGVIFTESTFSFLGIIDYGTNISIGKILSNGQAVMQHSPHILLFPAIFISLLMLSFNMFGNGLRDAFNPSLRGVE